MKKLRGLEAPWTEDEILRNYKFCNSYRVNDRVSQYLLKNGASWSSMWLRFGQQVYPYDENFRAVSNYAINNEIGERKLKHM